MIRYLVTKAKLEELITAENDDWLKRAAERTSEFRKKGFYEEKSSIWSEVKPVYMRLQGLGKCAYCEREMERVELGKVEQDVEHFRPKGASSRGRRPRRSRTRASLSPRSPLRAKVIIFCLTISLTTLPPASPATRR